MNIVTDYLKEKGINKYQFSQMSGIPYSTICDIVSGKTPLKRCSAETIYKISEASGIPIETLVRSACDKPASFELFKNNICHEVKQKTEITFLIDLLESDEIRKRFAEGRLKESLYLLGMLDYLSRKNDVPLCEDYEDLRHYKFEEPIFPSSLLVRAEVMQDESIKTEAIKNAIPEFIRFNIVENEVENVC